MKAWFNKRKIFYLDLLERALWTFAQGFAAFWIVTGQVDDQTVTGALIAGGISVGKSILASSVGDPNSAATLPSPPDAAPPEAPPEEG